MDVDPFALEVPAREDVAQVRVALVRAGDVAPGLDRTVDDHAGTPQPDRPDVAGDAADRGEVGLVGEPQRRKAEQLSQLGLARLAIARKHDGDDLTAAAPQQQRLEEGARLHAEAVAQRIDRGDAGGRDRRGLRHVRRARRLLDASRRLLEVRPVVAVAAEGDAILPHLGEDLKLVRDVTAHRARVRLDADGVEAHAREDARVRAVLGPVAPVEAGHVGVEAVGVFHNELARAQEPGARARFVATLRLEVIDHERQLAVGQGLLLRVQVDELLVRVAHHELAAVVVGRAERDRLERVPAAGLLPGLRGGEDGHLELLAADPVHLFADDLLDSLGHAEAEREPGVEAGGQRARDRRAQHQAVPGCLGLGGRLAQGAAEKQRLSH